MSGPARNTEARAATVAVQAGGAVNVHAHGRILASAIRHGRGWAVLFDGQRHDRTTFDGVLSLLGVLPPAGTVSRGGEQRA